MKELLAQMKELVKRIEREKSGETDLKKAQ
jgi:hypothetical protein